MSPDTRPDPLATLLDAAYDDWAANADDGYHRTWMAHTSAYLRERGVTLTQPQPDAETVCGSMRPECLRRDTPAAPPEDDPTACPHHGHNPESDDPNCTDCRAIIGLPQPQPDARPTGDTRSFVDRLTGVIDIPPDARPTGDTPVLPAPDLDLIDVQTERAYPDRPVVIQPASPAQEPAPLDVERRPGADCAGAAFGLCGCTCHTGSPVFRSALGDKP